MKRSTPTIVSLALLTCLNADSSAQVTAQFRIDSTATINEHLCHVMNIYFDGELHETDWFFEENGYVRWYAYITYGMGSDTLDWDSFYSVKQSPQVGDTWLSWVGGPVEAKVADTITLTVPAGTFPTFKIEYRDTTTGEVMHVAYCADMVGTVAFEHQGSYGELTSYSPMPPGGNGCFPMWVGNQWNYEADSLGIPLAPPMSQVNRYILQTHPNPFNPTTILSFELPVASYVRLEVFDVNGRLVGAQHAAPLPSRSGATPTMYPAGAHQITFDGSGLPSGIYLAKLVAGELQQMQKLVLLK